MPRYQGQLDGLCGQYAIVNAMTALRDVEAKHVFETACHAIARSRWPHVVWEGTEIGDMKRMIRRCLEQMPALDGVEVAYPFLRRQPSSSEHFWGEFYEMFEQRRARYAILGLSRPRDHWMGVKPKGGRLMFIDSDPHKAKILKSPAQVHMGKRRTDRRQWRAPPTHLIVFSDKA
jgi:hypothetical protein